MQQICNIMRQFKSHVRFQTISRGDTFGPLLVLELRIGTLPIPNYGCAPFDNGRLIFCFMSTLKLSEAELIRVEIL